jgi:hypothetical protein
VNRLRGQILGQRPLQVGRAPVLLTPAPYTLAASVVNPEPHAGASPSVRLCVGPELARCVHSLGKRTHIPIKHSAYSSSLVVRCLFF